MTYSQSFGNDRLVLVALASYVLDEYEVYCGHETLALDANICVRTIANILKRLEKLGEISVTHGGGRGRLTKYTINLPVVENLQQVAAFRNQQTPQKPAKPCNIVAGNGADKTLQIDQKPCNQLQVIEKETLQSGAETLQIDMQNPANRPCAYKEVEIRGKKGMKESAREERDPLQFPQVKAFVSAYPDQPATIHLTETLKAVTDLEAWAEVLKFWRTNRYSVRNLSGMIDRYNTEIAKKAKTKSYDGFWNRNKKPTGVDSGPVPAVASENQPSQPALAARARAGSDGRVGHGAGADQRERPAPPVSLRTRFPREAPIWKTINAGRSAVRVEQVEERDDLEFLFGSVGTSEQ